MIAMTCYELLMVLIFSL